MDPPSPPSDPPADWWARWPYWARRRSVIAAAVGVASSAVVLALVVLRPPSPPAPTLTLPQAGAATTVGHGGLPATTPTTGAGLVTVHAAGAVVSPGIYALASGARVADVVTAAGGPLAEADLDRLNLAARLADGDRVYVPRKGEAVPATPAGSPHAAAGAAASTTSASGPLDLNTATVDQLDTLPGIGPATAQAIVAYRTRHGRFRSVTELLEVPGIGPSKLEAVRPLVRV